MLVIVVWGVYLINKEFNTFINYYVCKYNNELYNMIGYNWDDVENNRNEIGVMVSSIFVK